MASNHRVTRFVGNGQPWDEKTIAARISLALEHIPLEQVGAVRWFIAEHNTDPVGLVVSTRKEDGVEIGYWVSPECWGKGVAGTMIDEAITALPKLFTISSLIARVDPANEASTQALIRRGFVLASNEDGLDRYIKRF